MPSKIVSKTMTRCVSKGDCLGVCLKSCKISKTSSPLGRLPSESAKLYLSCQKNQNESADTIFDSCKVVSHNKDVNESELASDTAVLHEPPLQVDSHHFDKGTEVLMEMDSLDDCSGIYVFKRAHINSGDDNDTHLDVSQFGSSGDDNGSSYAKKFCNDSPIDGKSRTNDSSENNIYSTNVANKQDTLLQGEEGGLMSSVHEEKEDTLSLSYTDSCDEDDSWFGLDLQFEVHRQGYEFESIIDSESMAALDSDFFSDLPSLLDPECSTWLLSPPKNTNSEKPITLVLDLDETLVHTTASPCDGTDFSFQLEERVLYVRKRPFLHAFLERVSELFRIIIFTAGTRNYADHVLDILDPGRRLTSRRAYRDSCTFSDNSYTKDLTVLGFDLAKLALVDNTPAVFHEMQVNNGIPIKSWFGDPTDQELLSLLPFLEILAGADDVRPFIADKFGFTSSP
ncbi:hypothetical protein QQ045_004198 [Rhodiola kirilowii]